MKKSKNKKLEIKNLAIFGGQKSIIFKQPHWKWPPQSSGKNKAINNYYKNEKYNRYGYPQIVEDFEKAFAKFHNSKYSLTTNSGTSSLHAAFFAVGIREYDEVLVPALTFHATASPLKQLKAIPIVCDIEEDTGNIDPVSIESKITSKTKAIVITHLCGHPCDMKKILKIKKKYNLALIEDCSHAHGSKYNNKLVGTFGDIACFSLGNQKMLPSGEGGILITNKKSFFQKALLISDFSQRVNTQITQKELKKFLVTGFGFKHRIHPVSAAIANFELKNLKKYINKRNKILNQFSKKISDIKGISPPITRNKCHRGAYFGYRPFVQLDTLNNIHLDDLIEILQAEGMEVRRASHQPLHLLHLFKSTKNLEKIQKIKSKNSVLYYKGDLPKAEKFYDSTISIPTFTFEDKKLIESYIKCFSKVFSILRSNKINLNKL